MTASEVVVVVEGEGEEVLEEEDGEGPVVPVVGAPVVLVPVVGVPVVGVPVVEVVDALLRMTPRAFK